MRRSLPVRAENAVAQNKVLSKILDNQQKMAEAVQGLLHSPLASLKLLLPKRPVSWYHLNQFQQDSLFSRRVWYWFEGGQNFLMEESSGNRKGRLGQTCNREKIMISGLIQWEEVDILKFGEGLSDSMGLMEVSSFGYGLFWLKRERFVSWFQDKGHNNQTFQRALLEGQLLDLLLHIFL